MRTVAMGKLINLSIIRTKLILFQPFSLKKWLCLLLIASLAGALGIASNGNSNHSMHSQKSEVAQITNKLDSEILLSQFSTNDTLYGNQNNKEFDSFPDDSSYPESQSYKSQSKPSSHKLVNIFLLIFLVIPLVILFAWLGSRFKFIWFDAITKNDTSIAAAFRQHKDKGNSLFEFFLIAMLSAIAFFILIAFWIFNAAKTSGISGNNWSFQGVFGAFLPPALIAIIGVISLVLLYTIIDHFVVTIMAIDNCLFKPAWDKFVKIFRNNQKEFRFYILILIGLGIICTIISLIAAMICLISILPIAAILFGIPYLLLKMSAIFIGYAIIAGVPFIAIAFIILASIQLPFAVFFRSFSLYFLSSIGCEYNPLEL